MFMILLPRDVMDDRQALYSSVYGQIGGGGGSSLFAS